MSLLFSSVILSFPLPCFEVSPSRCSSLNIICTFYFPLSSLSLNLIFPSSVFFVVINTRNPFCSPFTCDFHPHALYLPPQHHLHHLFSAFICYFPPYLACLLFLLHNPLFLPFTFYFPFGSFCTLYFLLNFFFDLAFVPLSLHRSPFFPYTFYFFILNTICTVYFSFLYLCIFLMGTLFLYLFP